MTKTEEMKALIEQLNKASDAYYNGREELMTNYEWDALFDRLTRLEQESPPTRSQDRKKPTNIRHSHWQRRRSRRTW